jgi:DNA-binding CsgD family transcriptional regulator
MARRGSELAQRTGDRPYVVCLEALLGSLDLALGDYPAAVARLGPLARTLPEIGWHATTQSIAPDVAEALIATGELDQAAVFLAEVELGMRDPLTRALTARCRGLLAAARGDLDLAVTELTTALRLHDLISPHPLDQGRSLLALGSARRRLNQRAAARATLSDALATFERIDAPLWAAQARDHLARISGRSPRPVDLSGTELRVAQLVASGRSNKEAAAELFVAVRTIEATLTRIYAKLGVRSRTELAARLHAAAGETGPPVPSR